MPDAFDAETLMDRIEDDLEFLEETLTMLDEDLPGALEAVRAAVASGDAEGLRTSAHAVKGMLSNFCAEPAETAARELEMMGREQRLGDATAAVAALERETAQLQQALHQFVASRTA